MSNIAFDYLTESPLFELSKNNYKDMTIKELGIELDKYRKYIDDKYGEIEKEITDIKGDKIVQNSQLAESNCEDMNKIIKASLFSNTYVLNDPLFNIFYDDVTLERTRRLVGKIDEERTLKAELAGKVNYMKGLVEGVRTDTNFIKFIPLYYNAIDIKPNKIRFPSLDIKPDDDLFKWFKDKIDLYNIDNENKINKIPKYTDKIAINFYGNSNMDFFILQYEKLYYGKNNITSDELKNWIDQEIIKSINDEYSYLISKQEMYKKFNSNLIINNDFEKEFYKQKNIKTSYWKNKELNIKMNFIGLFDVEFNKAMEIRRKYEGEFKNFQEKLDKDLLILKVTEDENMIKQHLEDMKKKYDEESINIRKKIISFDGILSRNITDIVTTIIKYIFLNSNVTIGLDSFNILKKEYTYQKQKKKNNPIFIISKL